MSLKPKLPPYMRKKSPPGGFFGKPFPPNSPYHLIMSVPQFNSASCSPQLSVRTGSNGHSPTPSNGSRSPKSPLVVNLPRGFVPMEHQVAGHTFQENNPNELGLLKQFDGCVLKPAGKADCGAREISFYEGLKDTEAPEYLASLRDLVPRYKGTEQLAIDGREVTFIKLEDLTDKLYEPCVMDIKIGRRTWDPLASQAKRDAEESKYQGSKQSMGFCIPGFQVHSVKTGRVRRFGKDYGKKLTEQTIKEAFRIFLNAESGLCRALLMPLLSTLWEIQSWARSQTNLRIYSSSVLLVYDARRLRATLEANKRNPSPPLVVANGSSTGPPTGSTSSIGNSVSSPFSWDNQSSRGLNRSVSSASSASGHSSSLSSATTSPTNANNSGSGGEPIQSFKKIQRNHSVNNNYDQDIKQMQVDYVFMLDNLVNRNEERRKDWATAKMIDFAHIFPSEDSPPTVDQNYLFGIENLVKIFEEFLKECDQ